MAAQESTAINFPEPVVRGSVRATGRSGAVKPPITVIIGGPQPRPIDRALAEGSVS